MTIPLRLLIISDSEDDTALLLHELRRGGFSPFCNRIETKDALITILDQRTWDLLICEHSLPKFNALSALEVLQEKGLDLPCIVVSATASAEAIVETIKAGACDFIIKDNLIRLTPAAKRELREKGIRQEGRIAETAPLQSDKKQTTIFNIFPYIVAILDSESGQILSIDQTVQRMLGFDSRSLVGRNFSILFSPDRSPYVERLIKEIRLYKSVFKRLTFRSAHGMMRSLDFTASLVSWEGSTAILVILHDNLHRKYPDDEATEDLGKYLEILEANPDPVVVCGTKGRVIYFNPAFANVFGWALEEQLGKNLFFFVPEDKWPETKKMLDEAISGKRFSNIESRRFTKNKEIIPVSISGAAYRDRNGNPAGTIFTLRDIREKKKVEEQFLKAQKMQAIGTLAGGIAHDFNNLLFPIMGFTEMTLDDLPQGSLARKNLEEVFKAAKRASRLVQQILSFSRETYKEKKPIQIQPVVKEALNFMRASLPSTIEMRQKIDTTDGTVKADPTQIHQVIMNLCTNSYQSMQEIGGKLEVTLREVEVGYDDLPSNLDLHPGKYLRLSVGDTGRGIEPESIKRIFDPYFSTKGMGEGTGLGLSVVQGIVRSHGGYIDVESKIGEGTSFHVYFPVFGAVVMPVPIELPETTPQGKERILFVDDEEQNVRMTQQMLKSLGYDVTTRTSSVEALELFRSKPKAFDLVITDQTMPNMTGILLAQKIKDLRPEIPIILCTGLSEVITEENAKIFGIKKCVVKPVVRSELAKTIRQVLEQEK